MAPNLKNLKRARHSLWQRYQKTYDPIHQEDVSGFQKKGEHEAYMLSRFPATYGACCSVFARLFETAAFQEWSRDVFTDNVTVLDIGSGPGTASLALCDTLLNYQSGIIPNSITCIDQDDPMLEKCTHHLKERCKKLITTHNIISPTTAFPPADVVIMSYMLAEVTHLQQEHVLSKAFLAAKHALILINPGTSSLFPVFLKWRQKLISLGGFIAAPCPHMTHCPLDPDLSKNSPHTGPGWCHFKTRIARTRDMKFLKNATMSFEDEPYNYLIILKKPLSSVPSARVMNAPQKRKGHLHMHLCTEGTINHKTFSARIDNYQSIKKTAWGDGIVKLI